MQLKDKSGENVSGLPIEPGKMGSTGEVVLDIEGETLVTTDDLDNRLNKVKRVNL